MMLSDVFQSFPFPVDCPSAHCCRVWFIIPIRVSYFQDFRQELRLDVRNIRLRGPKPADCECALCAPTVLFPQSGS